MSIAHHRQSNSVQNHQFDTASLILPWFGDPTRALRLEHVRTVSAPKEAISLCLIFGLALVLRVATLADDSLWIDEGYTLAAAQLPLGTMWTVPFDTHPPLHFTFVKLFSWISEPEWAVRLPSVLFALATLFPLYLMARRQIGNLGALVTIAIWGLSYTQIVYANNGRNYTELLFFLVLALHALIILSERLASGDVLQSNGLTKWWALYTIGALGALYTHNTAIIYLFAINALLCAWQLINQPRAIIPFVLRLAALNAVAILLWLPWLAVMLSATGGFNWLAQKSIPEAVYTLAATIGPNDTPAIATLAFLGAVAIGWALVVLRASLFNLIIAFHLILFPALIWLIGFAYVPIFMERIILMATLGAALAIGVLAAKARPLALGPGLAGLALAVTFASALAYQFRSSTTDNLGAHLIQDWREAIVESEAKMDGNAPVGFAICDTFSWPVASIYAGESTVYVHRPNAYWDMAMEDWLSFYGQPVNDRLETSLDDIVGPTRTPADLLATYTRIVFLQTDIYCQGEEADQIHSELTGAGFRRIESRDYRGLVAHHYIR